MYSIIVKTFSDIKGTTYCALVGIKTDGIDESMQNVKACTKESMALCEFNRRAYNIVMPTKGKKE
jgi:hypothetical protein